MLAMQYSIPLPPNYDSALIHERVNARRGLFDGHAGLVHKSFLYNRKEHLYAPFYIWKDVTEARDFLLDELFHGVIETFSRHRVRSWFVVSMQQPSRSFMPTYALREVDIIPPENRIDAFLKQEQHAQASLLQDPNLSMHAIAIDADRWEILRFTLWKDRASAAKPYGDSVVGYDVLHVSTPYCS